MSFYFNKVLQKLKNNRPTFNHHSQAGLYTASCLSSIPSPLPRLARGWKRASLPKWTKLAALADAPAETEPLTAAKPWRVDLPKKDVQCVPVAATGGPHSCRMKITEGARKYAAQKGISDETALKKGWKKSRASSWKRETRFTRRCER